MTANRCAMFPGCDDGPVDRGLMCATHRNQDSAILAMATRNRDTLVDDVDPASREPGYVRMEGERE